MSLLGKILIAIIIAGIYIWMTISTRREWKKFRDSIEENKKDM